MSRDSLSGMDGGAAVTIRPAAATDAPRLAELMTELGYPASAQAVRERLADWLSDPASRVLVAERGGRVVGCVSLHAIPYLERTGSTTACREIVQLRHEREPSSAG